MTAARTAITVGFLFLSTLTQIAAAQKNAIRVLASNGVKAVMQETQPQCERAIGHPLAMQFDTTAAVEAKIRAGEEFDVAVLTSKGIDELIREGKAAKDTRADVSRAGIGIGVRAGAPRPEIGTSEALKRALLNSRSVTYAGDGASRVYIESMFRRLGIADELRRKTILEQGSVRSTAAVLNGRAELVLTLISEILPVHGIEFVGPLPAEYQHYVSFAAAVGTHARDARAARALIGILTGPGIASTFREHGMEPH